MFDLDEINLMPSKVPPKKGQDGDAHARAKAIELGAKWKCSRVKKWVDLDVCVQLYAEAKDKGEYAPCLECASLTLHLREMGRSVTVNTKGPEQAPVEPKKIIIVQEDAMARPAKKGTPDPIIVEAKEEPHRLEIVAKPEAGANPFAGWVQYAPADALRGKLDVFASFSSAGILSLSVAAQEQIKLQLYSSVDVLHKNGKLGLRLHAGKSGALAIVAKTKSRSSATVSARGFMRQFKLEHLAGKRFQLREIQPGFVEIDLGKEVRAA